MKKMESFNKIIIHCSASDHPADDSVGRIKHVHTATKFDIVTWDNKISRGFGFDAIGYHFVITKDGQIHHGRSIKYQGAHCYGQNQHSIGICLTGETKFTLKQFKSLFALLDAIKEDHGVSDVYGHSYFSKTGKTCPNFGARL